jgi:hypothetical protein
MLFVWKKAYGSFRYLEVDEQTYFHLDCFRCLSCNTLLGKDPFVPVPNGYEISSQGKCIFISQEWLSSHPLDICVSVAKIFHLRVDRLIIKLHVRNVALTFKRSLANINQNCTTRNGTARHPIFFSNF